MRWVGLAVIAAMLVAGCGKPAETPPADTRARAAGTSPAESPGSAEQVVFDQLSGGAFQASAALDLIETARNGLVELLGVAKSPIREGLEDARDLIDSAGQTLADEIEKPDNVETVKNDFAAFDERRLKAIEAANDARHELEEALGIVQSLSEAGQLSQNSLDPIVDALQSAIEASGDMATELGGKVEEADQPAE
jgi:hypothetical protein